MGLHPINEDSLHIYFQVNYRLLLLMKINPLKVVGGNVFQLHLEK
jgi:hypothetical protein